MGSIFFVCLYVFLANLEECFPNDMVYNRTIEQTGFNIGPDKQKNERKIARII